MQMAASRGKKSAGQISARQKRKAALANALRRNLQRRKATSRAKGN